LINSIVRAQNTSGVDTVAELNELVRIGNAMVTLAQGQLAQPLVSTAEFARMGIVGVTEGNRQAVLKSIADVEDSGAGVSNLAQIQALVDAHAVDLNISTTAFLGVVFDGLTVIAYDDQGHEMGRHTLSSDPAGTMLIQAKGWGNYHGALLLELIDSNGQQVNYNDESTGLDVDLGLMLRAMVTTDDSSYRRDSGNHAWLNVTITPVTEMAVRLALQAGEMHQRKAP
jgi:hypothetical protein